MAEGNYDQNKVTSWAYNEPKYKLLLEKLNIHKNSVRYVGREDIRKFIFEKLYCVLFPHTSILSVLSTGEQWNYSILNLDGTRTNLTSEQFADFFHIVMTSETITKYGVTVNKNLYDFSNGLSKTTLLGMTSTSHFQLEVFFDLLKEPIKNMTDKRWDSRSEYYDIINELCPNVNSDIKDIMTVLQFTRNTMHNDGMHNNPTLFHYEIEGVRYDFVNKELSDVSSWGHFYLIFDKIIDAIYQIVTDEKIKTIEGPLQTEYMKKIFSNNSDDD